ncbi:helix-turn-helix transcriptional regulator [Pseudoruegeria sp. SHC-113]|uniref:helix-turn-helix transcriptional regulator n=1 Tax=Pseudoruegeria sp. SHC-113 TaxID=2855439 RepID=UPI0021BADF4F|nr:AraC family transcriptional regulator [Pseudoruegeria sp. SHC-113]MCT8161531.1 AraC family transcriptional regulator [Pseudoruegeria sp. SHC-113]
MSTGSDPAEDQAKDQAGDFASAVLLAHVVQWAGRYLPEVSAPSGAGALTGGKAAAETKRRLLEQIAAQAGLGALIAAGIGFAQAQSGEPSGLFAALTAAPSPAVALQKWARLERYFHSRNRTRITLASPTRAEVARYSLSGDVTPEETALIAGVMAGLLAASGGGAVRLEIGGAEVALPITSENWRGIIHGDIAGFALTWAAEPGRIAVLTPNPSGDAASLAGQLEALLASDLARGWTLAQAARALGLSTRSLQRGLAAEGQGYTACLRRARVEAAGRALAETMQPLAEIGFCAGYADQAHFQREFKRMSNMTPAAFRAVAQLSDQGRK